MKIEYIIAGIFGIGVVAYLMTQPPTIPPVGAPAVPTVPGAPSAPTVIGVPTPVYPPAPVPTPTPALEPEGTSMQESLIIAENVVRGSSPFPIDDCHSLANTGSGLLRVPYGYWFTFGYTCNKIGMMPMVATYSAAVTVINGVVTSVEITRINPP